MYDRVSLSLGAVYPGPPRTCLGTMVRASPAAAEARNSRRWMSSLGTVEISFLPRLARDTGRSLSLGSLCRLRAPDGRRHLAARAARTTSPDSEFHPDNVRGRCRRRPGPPSRDAMPLGE